MNASRALIEILGTEAVSTDPVDLDEHSGDQYPPALVARRRGDAAAPACVVRPSDTAQVAALLAWADEQGVPVVPYGGGSGVCGAVHPHDAVVVDTRRLNQLGAPDETSRLVTVGAGVMGPDLSVHLARGGFTLGHEPQSIATSTVGGWVATRACGQLSARYGGIENLVAGLQAVLPGGRVVRWKTGPRRAAGPEVAALMIGSEGTLGIVTEATLRISPRVDERVDRCVRFDTMAEGIAACRALAQSDLQPTLVRLYDADDAAVFLRKLPDEEPAPLLLLSLDGPGAEGRAAQALETCRGKRASDVLTGHWWRHRNDATTEYGTLMAGEGILGPHALVDTIEVSGTWTVLSDLYHSMKEALNPVAMLAGCHLSHVYPDGAALYFTLAAACDDDESAVALDEKWWEAGMTACLRAGGSISHHHGIGRVRARWLEEELDGWLDVLRAVTAIDPRGIMNPGALGL